MFKNQVINNNRQLSLITKVNINAYTIQLYKLHCKRQKMLILKRNIHSPVFLDLRTQEISLNHLVIKMILNHKKISLLTHLEVQDNKSITRMYHHPSFQVPLLLKYFQCNLSHNLPHNNSNKISQIKNKKLLKIWQIP